METGDPASQLPLTATLIDRLFAEALRIDTCQRILWIFASFEGAPQGIPSEIPDGTELLTGADAYRFLLEVATGLQSEVQGETDVFGQVKEAWAKFKGPSAARLQPWMIKLFEDAKEIRAHYLQNAGQASYGALVRRLIKQQLPAAQAPILVLGAGQIAASIAPWLSDQELWLWNRTQSALLTMCAEIQTKNPDARVRLIVTPEDEQHAFQEAAHVVICVPPGSDGEDRQIALWNLGLSSGRAVIHLGGMRAQVGAWSKTPIFYGLDDIFALQKEREVEREGRFEKAFHACDSRARLRALPGSHGGSVSLPHGWEDLAVFG